MTANCSDTSCADMDCSHGLATYRTNNREADEEAEQLVVTKEESPHRTPMVGSRKQVDHPSEEDHNFVPDIEELPERLWTRELRLLQDLANDIKQGKCNARQLLARVKDINDQLGLGARIEMPQSVD